MRDTPPTRRLQLSLGSKAALPAIHWRECGLGGCSIRKVQQKGSGFQVLAREIHNTTKTTKARLQVTRKFVASLRSSTSTSVQVEGDVEVNNCAQRRKRRQLLARVGIFF
jgi:hypothetical protein